MHCLDSAECGGGHRAARGGPAKCPTSFWPTSISTAARGSKPWRLSHAATKIQAPVIVITADHSAEVQREIRTRGYALLRKPLKAAALRALMYQLTLQRAVAAE